MPRRRNLVGSKDRDPFARHRVHDPLRHFAGDASFHAPGLPAGDERSRFDARPDAHDRGIALKPDPPPNRRKGPPRNESARSERWRARSPVTFPQRGRTSGRAFGPVRARPHLPGKRAAVLGPNSCSRGRLAAAAVFRRRRPFGPRALRALAPLLFPLSLVLRSGLRPFPAFRPRRWMPCRLACSFPPGCPGLASPGGGSGGFCMIVCLALVAMPCGPGSPLQLAVAGAPANSAAILIASGR